MKFVTQDELEGSEERMRPVSAAAGVQLRSLKGAVFALLLSIHDVVAFVTTTPTKAPYRDPSLKCGVLAICDSKMSTDDLRLQTLTLQRLVRHRGPDGSGIHVLLGDNGRTTSIAHERLAIVDPLSGNQPLYSHDRTLVCTVNGEIYNHKQLRAEMKDQRDFRTASDCEVIVHLYNEIGNDVASKLDGDFAFVIVNEETGAVYAARDPVGVNSLYIGRGADGSVWISSEVKPLVAGNCISIDIFPPGHYYSSADSNSDSGGFTRYYKPAWLEESKAKRSLSLDAIQKTFVAAVDKRLMSDVPYGVFLSGGLDSSLVASVITRVRRKRFLERGSVDDLQPLKSFSIGLEG